MIARKRPSLQDDLMAALGVGLVEGRHQQVQVCRQCLHHVDLVRLRADHGRHHGGRPLVGVEPRWQRRAIQRLEVALHALRGPGAQVLADPLGGPFGLQAERVAAKVGALFRVSGRGSLNWC
jgi:hypothetical protein